MDSEIALAYETQKQAAPDAKRKLQIHSSDASTVLAGADLDDDQASMSSIASTLSWKHASEAPATRKKRLSRFRPGRRAARRLRSQQLEQTMKVVAADCLLEQQLESSGIAPLTVIGHMAACLESIDEEKCEEALHGTDVSESLADFWGRLPESSSSSSQMLPNTRKRKFPATDRDSCEREADQEEEHPVGRQHPWAASLSEHYSPIEEALSAMREFLDTEAPTDFKDLPIF